MTLGNNNEADPAQAEDPMADAKRRLEEKRTREETRNRLLLNAGFGEPYELDGGGGVFGIAAMIGGSSTSEFTDCLRCGSAVRLNVPEEDPERPGDLYERNIRTHLAHHELLEKLAGSQT